MSAPHILSTTIGSLPSFTISKDLADKSPVRPRLAPVSTKAAPKVKTETSARRRDTSSAVIAVCLILTNVVLAGFYFYNINNAKALEYNARQAQRTLGQLQDRQRQYQVHIAEASAVIRGQESAMASGGFVPLGTPEFISEGGSVALTMR